MTDLSLTSWYANPLDSEQATQQLSEAREQLKRPQGRNTFRHRVHELIARFWLDKDIANDVQNMVATATPREVALMHLIYGQLLLSRKREGAFAWLERGLHLASPFFERAEYLEVMRRHEQLKHLKLSVTGSAPLPLDALLKESAVIRQLEGKAADSSRLKGRPDDTVG